MTIYDFQDFIINVLNYDSESDKFSFQCENRHYVGRVLELLSKYKADSTFLNSFSYLHNAKEKEKIFRAIFDATLSGKNFSLFYLILDVEEDMGKFAIEDRIKRIYTNLTPFVIEVDRNRDVTGITIMVKVILVEQ